MPHNKLPHDFYRRDDVVLIARELLGMVLCTSFNGTGLTAGMITETEAYRGRNDKACHANNGTRTERTEIMYHAGGVAYVYLCYGIHHLFNVVTNETDRADAVLIRAVEPLDGLDSMLKRRGLNRKKHALTAGPGRLSQALGITTGCYGADLSGDTLWIEDRSMSVTDSKIIATPRIGVAYAGEHALRPWRFTIDGNKWVSK